MAKARETLLITGATGFLGSEVLRLACERDWHVRALVRNSRQRVPGAEAVVGTLGDKAALLLAMEGVAAVIHTAGLAHVFGKKANNIAAFTEVNEAGTANVVEAAVQCRVERIVLASSVSVYGASADGNTCDESTLCRPQTVYAISKYRAELRAAEAVAGTDTSLCTLRFATIYGEGDRGNVAKLVRALKKGRFIWPGTGRNRKSLIYRSDAATACLLALDRTPKGISVYNVAAEPVSMRQIVTAICDGLQIPVPTLCISERLLTFVMFTSRHLGDPAQLGERIRKFLHDDVYPGTHFQNACGYQTAVSLERGMRLQATSASPKQIPPHNR